MSTQADTGEVREALQRHGCAICHLADRATARFLRSVAYEQVNDVSLREQLRATRGFCTTHAHRWLRDARSVLGTALIYRDAITAALRDLDEQPSSSTRGSPLRALFGLGSSGATGSTGSAGSPPSVCVACRIQQDAQDRYLDALLSGVASGSLGEALDRSEGVCLPHTLRAIERGGPRAEPIRQRSRAVAERLVQHLDEVIRKEDYRFRHEPRTDDERAAPRRAVTWASGLEGFM
jgi:hypothetical protein